MSEATATVDALVAELEKKPFADLCALPARTDKAPAKKQSMAIWRDLSEDGVSVRIVVQLYERRFLGMGSMYAQGFRKISDGRVEALKQEELYEFS